MQVKYMKKVENNTYKIRLPKVFVELFGKEIYLEMDTEKGIIVITPIKKGN